MEFKQLQSFVEVVKQNSFTKAAENLYLSQPTLSVHIRQIEEELKTRLILRTTKSIELTPKGHEFYEYAVNILELRDKMIEDCSVDTQKIIHIGASTIPASYILPDLLSDLGAQHPEIYFVIHQSDSQGIIDKLMDGVLDIGIVGMKNDDEELEFIPFSHDHMVLVTPVTEQYLSREATLENTMDILLNDPIILREKGSGTRKNVDHIFEKMGITDEQLNVAARANDQETIKNLVAGGVGVSIISQRAAANFINEKRLIGFPLPDKEFSRELYVVYKKKYVMKRAVKTFADFAIKTRRD